MKTLALNYVVVFIAYCAGFITCAILSAGKRSDTIQDEDQAPSREHAVSMKKVCQLMGSEGDRIPSDLKREVAEQMGVD